MNLRFITSIVAICVVLLLCNICIGFAQETTTSATITTSNTLSYEQIAKNTVYVELLGNSQRYSINYDRLLTNNISGRVGFLYNSVTSFDTDSLLDIISYNGFSITIPFSASYLFHFPQSPSYIETGLGITVSMISMSERTEILTGRATPISQISYLSWLVPMLGYRLQPQLGGFNFRVIACPIIILPAMYQNRTLGFSINI